MINKHQILYWTKFVISLRITAYYEYVVSKTSISSIYDNNMKIELPMCI